MPDLKRFLSFSACAVASALVMQPRTGHATDGTAGNIDFSRCRPMVSEREIAQWGPFDPTSKEVFTEQIVPILNAVKNLPSPNLYNALQLVFKKKWSFDLNSKFDTIADPTDPSKKIPCLVENLLYADSTPSTKKGCQSSGPNGQVILDPLPFFGMDPKTCKHPLTNDEIKNMKQIQRDTYVHEMLLGILLDTNRDLSAPGMQTIFKDLTEQPINNDWNKWRNKLENDLENTSFEDAVTQALQAEAVKGNCPPPKKEILTPPAATAIQDTQAATLKLQECMNRALKDGSDLTALSEGVSISINFSDATTIPKDGEFEVITPPSSDNGHDHPECWLELGPANYMRSLQGVLSFVARGVIEPYQGPPSNLDFPVSIFPDDSGFQLNGKHIQDATRMYCNANSGGVRHSVARGKLGVTVGEFAAAIQAMGGTVCEAAPRPLGQ